MAGRKWKDINELWLERYLAKAGLMPLWAGDPEGADMYEDHPFAWQASWVLSDAEWSRLRSAWEHDIHPRVGPTLSARQHTPQQKNFLMHAPAFKS